MQKGTFGEHLRREREMRGVALEEIASATRISTRFLEALENERWEHLPGGVFNRGFIRAVSRFLGLDEESLIAEYSLATHEAPQVAVRASAPARPRFRLRLWLAAALLMAVGGGGLWAYRHYAPLLAAWGKPLPQVPRPNAPTVPALASTTPPAPPASPPAAGPSPAEPLELKVEAGKATVVTVVADGKTIFQGRFAAGQNQRFQANNRFEISSRDGSALLLELNGQTVPPLGPPGQPGSITLSHRDLKKPLGGQN